MNHNCKICNEVIREAINDEFYTIDIYNINNPKMIHKLKRVTIYYICKSCYKKHSPKIDQGYRWLIKLNYQAKMKHGYIFDT